jgi:hypothetical protein
MLHDFTRQEEGAGAQWINQWEVSAHVSTL